MKVKESEKAGLKLNIQKTKIMAPGPITSWQIEGETVEAVTGFTFLGSKTTANGGCRHRSKRRSLPGRKVTTKKKEKLRPTQTAYSKADSTLPTKVCSESYGFSNSHVWMSWTIRLSTEELMLLNCGAEEDS